MRNPFYSFVLIAFLSITAYSQECPQNLNCITPAQAREYLTLQHSAPKQEAKIAERDKAIKELQDVITDLKIQLAKITGEKTGADQTVIEYRSMIQNLLPYLRKKKIGIFNAF